MSKDVLHARQVFEVGLFIIIGSASTWLVTELANRLRFATDQHSHHVHAFIRRYEPYLTEYLIRC